MEYFIQGSDRGGRNSKRAKATRKRRKTSKALKHAQSPSHSPSSQPVTRESRKAKPKRGSKRNKGSHATPSKRQKRRQGERQGESRGQDPLPNLPGTSGKDKDKGQDEDDNNAAQANVPGISHRHLASTPNRGAHPSSPPHRASSSLPAAFSTPRPVSASSPPPVAPPPVGSMTASSPPPVGSMTGSLVLGSTVRGVLSSSSKRIRKRRRRSRGSPEEDTPHTPLTPHASSTSHIIRDQPSEQTFEFGNDEDSDSDNHLRHEYTESNGDADGAHGKGGEKKEKKTTKKGKKKGKRKRPQSGTRKCLRAELEQNKELEGARQREKKEEKKERAKQARAERMAKRNLRQVVSTVEGEEGEEEEKEEGEDSDDLQFDNSDNANEEKERKGSNDRALDAVDVDTGPGDEENDKDPSNDIERVHDHGHAGDNDKDGVHGNEKENDNTHNSQLTGTHSQAESDDQHQHHDQHKHKHQYPQAQTQPQLYGRQAMPSSCPSKTLTHAKGGSGKEAREEREGNRKERDEREEKGGRGGGNGDNGNGNGNIHDNDDRDDRRSHDNVRIDASNIMDTDAGSKILSLSPNKGGEERRENIRRNVKKENQGDGYAKIKRTITKPNTEANEAEKRREGTHMTDSTIGVDSEIIHEYGSISAGDTSRATVQATTQRQGQCSSAMKKEGETCIEQEESSDSDTVAEEDFYRQRLERQKKEREEEITRSSRSNSNLNHNGTEHARVFVSTSVPSSDFTRVIGETEDITDDNIYSVGIDDHGRRKNSEDREDSEESEESEESEDDAEYEIGVDDSFEWNAKVEKRHWRELRLVEAIMQDQHTLMQACLEGGNLSGNGNGDTRTTFRSEARNSKRSHRSASNRALNKHKHAQVSPLCPARSVASLRLPITLLLQKIHRKQRLEPVLRKRRRERRKERKVLARNMLELRHRVTSQKYGGKEGKYSVELEDDSRDEAHDALLSVINDYRADIVDPAHSAERECKSAEESEGGLLHLCAMFNARRCAKVLLTRYSSDVNAQDSTCRTPIWVAVEFKHEAMAHFLAGWGADPTLVLELLTHENEGDDEGSSTKVTVATGGGANLPRHRAVLQRKSLLHLVCSKSYHEILLFLLRLIEFYENLSLAEYYEIVQAEYDELYRAYHGCHAGASSIWEADPVIAEEALVGENESLVEVSHTHSLPSQSCRTQSRSRDRSRFAEQKKKERQAAAEKEAAEKEVQHHQDHVVCCRPILSPWRNAMPIDGEDEEGYPPMHLILDNVEFMNHKHEVPINLSLCEALVEYRAYKTMRALLNYADFVDERLWKTEESKSRRQKKAKYATWAMQMKKKTNMNRSASNFSYLNHHHHLHPLSKPVVKSTKKSLIEKVDAYNVTALHWACEYRSTRLISLLLSHGADSLIPTYSTHLVQTDKTGLIWREHLWQRVENHDADQKRIVELACDVLKQSTVQPMEEKQMKFEERSKLHAKNEEERIQKDASKMSHSLFPGKLAGSTLGKKKTKKKKAKGLGEKVYREKEPEMPFFKNKQTISSIVTTPLPPFVRPLPNSFSPAFDTTPRLRKSLRIIKALNHHHCLERELLESELITSASNPLSFPPSLSFLNAVSAKVYQDMSPHNKEGSDKAGDSLDQRPASVDWSDRRYDFLWHTETLRKKPVRAHRDKFYFREDRNLSRKQYLSEHRRSPLHLAAMHASDIRNEQREKESIGYYEHSYLPVEAVLPTALKQNRGVSHANNQADQQASNRQDGSIVRLRSTRYFDTLKQLLDLLKKVGASASGLNLFAYDEYGYLPLHLAVQAGNHDASELLIKAMKEEVLQWCSLLDFNSAAASIVGAIRERANAHQGRGTKTSKKKGAKDPSRALSSHGRRINSAAEHSRKRAMGSIHERKYTASHGGKSASSKEDDIKRLRAALKRNNQQQPRKTSKSSKTNAPKLTANMAESHLTYEEDQMLKRRMKRREDNIQMVEQKLRSNLVSQILAELVDLPDLHHGKSALMMACKLQLNSSSSERGSQPHAVVTLLLNNGASLSATDFKGNSVLPWAIAYGRNEIVSYILRTLPPSTSARVQSPSALSRSQVTEDHHRKTLVGMLTQRNVRGWSPLHYMMMFALESDRHVQCAKTILESICKLRSNAWARKVIDSSFGCAPSPTTILSHVTKTILHLHSNVERGQNEAFKRMSEQANELKQMCNSFCIPREAKPLSPVWLPISYSTQVHKELSSDLKVGWGEIKRTFDEGICAPLSTDISNGKELYKVRVSNDVDDAYLPSFIFVRESVRRNGTGATINSSPATCYQCTCSGLCKPATCECMLKAKEMAMMNHDENQDNVIVACHSLCHCHMDCSNRTEFPGPPRQSNIIGTELETEMTMNATMVKMMEMGSTEERNGVSGDEQHTNFINNIKEMDESTETCCSIDGHEILVNVTAVPDGGGSIGMHRDRNIQRRAGRGTPFQLEIFRAQCNSLSRTPKREVQWAVRTRSFIPKGAMITEVVGEVMDVSIARERMLKESVKHYHSALKARFLPSECIDSPPMAEGNGYFRRMFQARGVCIDTSCFGNISRFVRETCEMCVDKDQRYVVNVSLKLIYSSHLEASVPRLGMIAGRNIKAGEELVFGHRPGMCMLRALPVPLMGIYRRHRPRYADGERKLSRSHRADGNSFHNVEESRTSLSHFFTSLSGMKNCSRDEEDKREQSGAGCGVGTVEERHKRADMVVDDENKDDRCANGEHSDDVDEGERGASNDEVEREKCGALMVIDDSVLKAFSSYQHRIVFV